MTHEHMCLKCRGVVLPEQRLGENHVAGRFESVAGYYAYLDGVDVSRDCTEAVAGRQGWVVLLCPSPQALCSRCRQGACASVRGGVVRIVRDEATR